MRTELEEFAARLSAEKLGPDAGTVDSSPQTGPVHVVYGGADRYTAGTPQKLGELALRSLETYAPDIKTFADAMWLKGADSIPEYPEAIQRLETRLATEPDAVRAENEGAWLSWTVRRRVIEKLQSKPVEDFRIDFEDGYGIRSDEEEDRDAVRAAKEFAAAVSGGSVTENSGIRIKSLQTETYARATKTLIAFLCEAFASTRLPDNFVVTLPKVKRAEEVSTLSSLLGSIEARLNIATGSIGLEIMVETPECLFDLPRIVVAGDGRVTSAHFGAYDYTASLGITANHQHLGHDACVFARAMMQASLTPLGIRLSDSVTTEMPVPVHRVDIPTERQHRENVAAVHKAWRRHFNNVTSSLINGFYQSWDLHPAQLVARYAAVTAFFLEGAEDQGRRLRGFVEKATKATLDGTVFDDAASAQGYLNFFSRAMSSGAMTEEEALGHTGLNAEELRSGSFKKILEGRG